jgi:hypothetical protein
METDVPAFDPDQALDAYHAQLKAKEERDGLTQAAQAFLAADFTWRDEETLKDWAERVRDQLDGIEEIAQAALAEAREAVDVPNIDQLNTAIEEAASLIAKLNQQRVLDLPGITLLTSIHAWLTHMRQPRQDTLLF